MSQEERHPLVAAAGEMNPHAALDFAWAPRAAGSILHPTVLQLSLPFLSPQPVVAASRVCTAFAAVVRTDTLWECLLARDWRRELGEEGAELQRRIRHEARIRRGLLLQDDAESRARKGSMHADVPVLSARALDTDPLSAPQSPAHQPVPSPVALPTHTTTHRHDSSGIPRARSIAALSSLMLPPAGSNANVLRSGVGPSPRPAISPTLQNTHLHASPESDGSDSTASSSPLKRSVSEGSASLTAALPFSFGSPAAAVAAVFSPRAPPRTHLLVAQRWLAQPDSLKAIYADVVRECYPRFHVASLLDSGTQLPRAVKLGALGAVAVACAAALLLWNIRGLRSASSPWWQHPRCLSLTCTLAASFAVCLLAANVVRVLRRSLTAKAFLWRAQPLPPPDASDEELEAAAVSAAFQYADQAWWRHHSTNRWYSVRYQVWEAPRARWLLVLLAGLGSFVLLWGLTTITLGNLWPAAGLGVGVGGPGATLVLAFQLGRMLRITRTTHQIVAIMLSLLQLVGLLLLLHAGNPCIVWILEFSFAGAFGLLLLAFAPNMILFFFLFWLDNSYITSAGNDAPVILPPSLARSRSEEDEEARSPRTEEAFAARSGMGRGRSMTIGFEDQSQHWASLFLPQAHTFGRLLCGGDFERRVIEGKCSPSFRSMLFSRAGLSVMGGAVIYLCTATYWSHLFSLFLNPSLSFGSLPLETRSFHLISLGAFVYICIAVSLLSTLVTLQNRNWQWWWQAVYVNVAAMGAIGLHWTLWAAGVQQGASSGVVDAWTSFSPAASSAGGMPSAARLRLVRNQLETHWAYQWSSWIAMLCCTASVSLCVCVCAMKLLYRPKSVREMLHSAAVAAAAEEAELEAQARSHHARSIMQQQQQQQHQHGGWLDDASRPHMSPRSHLQQPSASPVEPLSFMLHSGSLAPALFDAHMSSDAPMTFLQSLAEPASPEIPLGDASFEQHLREIEAHAAFARGELEAPEQHMQYPLQ